ncbi:MAG: lipopolysaccharide biosynthesis protein, partial [Bacteroidia bacterium]
MTQSKTIFKGAFYLTITNIFAQLLSLFVNIILGRLLIPSDFGVVALSTTFIGSITIFTSVGFGAAIIHFQKATHDEISTLYWINWILSIFTYLIIYISAAFSADFFSTPDLKNIVRISALSILLTPFYIIHYKQLERDLKFKLLSKISFISTFTGSIASIIGAFSGLGAYSLCLQPITSSFTLLIIVNWKSKWHPKFIFKLHEVKKMLWYSVKFKASNSFTFIERNIDYLILGKIYPSNVLGHYSFSYNIMYAPVKRISYLFNDVLFPSFSSYQNNKEKITQAYFKSTQLIALVSFPLMTLLGLNAELIIQLVFGDKWLEAIPIIKILCFAGAVQSIAQVG